MIGLKFGCLHCSGAPFPIVSCLLLYRKGHKSEMQKTRIKGKKFVQYLVKVNCETDFSVMLFLAVANGNVVRAVFCFRLFGKCFNAGLLQGIFYAASPLPSPALRARIHHCNTCSAAIGLTFAGRYCSMILS